MPRLFALFCLLMLPACAAERWQLQYLYDKDNAALTIVDMRFVGPTRGMAVGYEVKDRNASFAATGRYARALMNPVALITADGGQTWDTAKLPAIPQTLFFLNERLGWLLAEGRVYRTEEFGRDWKPLGKVHDVLRIHFVNEKHGFAAGAQKSLYETVDGGEHWTKMPIAAEHKTTEDYTVYSVISFANPRVGLIAGYSKPPRKQASRSRSQYLPDWMAPENRQREVPGTMVSIETKDGGATWKATQSALFGRLRQVLFHPDGRGLGLLEYHGRFDWPSELYQFNWRTGKTAETTFRRKDRQITDVAWPLGDGPAYMAAIEPPGTLPWTPFPGKLKILKSLNLSAWSEMPVDYRAEGKRAILSAYDAANIWVATDSGMILKLVQN